MSVTIRVLYLWLTKTNAINMINVNELRLGSIVSDGLNLKVVHMIGYKDGVLGAWITNPYSSDGGQFFAQVDLIFVPLTPEMLEECGFEEDKRFVTDEHPWVDYTIGEFSIQMPYFEFVWNDQNIEVKCLHQLQNLYFALTGQELDVSKIVS